MSDERRRLGDFGEGVARGYLRRSGYRILESNVRCPIGEIDIVARDGEYLVFVEVRTRRGSAFGLPEESVTAAKQEKLVKLAQFYLQQHPALAGPWRIDVVAVELRQDGRIARMELIADAVN